MHQKHPGPWEGSQNRGTLAGEIRRLPGAQLPQMCALSSGALLSFLSSAQQLSSKRGPGGAGCSKTPAWVAWTGGLGGALGWASERGPERCSRGPGPWTDQRRDPAQGQAGAAPPSYTQSPLWGPRPYWVQKLLLKGGETARGAGGGSTDSLEAAVLATCHLAATWCPWSRLAGRGPPRQSCRRTWEGLRGCL